jgi:TolB protein
MNDFKIGPERFITKADQVVLRPNWNLDGASLVLEVKSSAGSLLERCTLDGSPPTHLAPCNEGASIVQGRAAFFAKDDFAFVSDRGGRLSIWRADLSSGSVTPLTLPPPGASDYGPATAVGHEGRFLFFRKLEGHDGPYVFLGRAGAPDDVEQITSVPGNQPWPLNGMDDMLFHAMRDDMDRVYRQAILSDGSIAHVSAADEGLSYVTPFPSPDGTHIALATCIDALSQLVIMRSDGSGRQQVTAAPEPSMFPCWSPDGKALAFVRGNPLDPHAPTGRLCMVTLTPSERTDGS